MSLQRISRLKWTAVICGSLLLGGAGGKIASVAYQNSRMNDALRERAEIQEAILREMGTLAIGDTLFNCVFTGLNLKPARLADWVTSRTLLSIVDPDCEVCTKEIEFLCNQLLPKTLENQVLFLSAANPLLLSELQNAYAPVVRILFDYNREWIGRYRISTFPFNIVIDSHLVVQEIIAAQIVPEDLTRIGLIP